MIINYLKSYDRSFRKLEVSVRKRAVCAIDDFLSFLTTKQKPEGLGLKKVYHNYWEIRLDIRNRIIFQLEGEVINFVFIGAHNAVRVFLRNL